MPKTGNSCKTAGTANCKWRFSLAGIHKREHHERIQIPTRYIDEAGEISFPDNVGICDHINSCGYHYTPKEYFRDNPAVKERLSEQERNCRTPVAARPAAKPVPEQEPQISFLPSDWVEQSMRRYDINPLYRYFTKVAGKEDTDRLFRLYRVGTSRMWNGAAVF